MNQKPPTKKPIVPKKSWKLILIGLLLCFTGFGPVSTAFMESDKVDAAELRSCIIAAMKQYQVPGLSVVIFRDQKILYRQGFGVKNTKTGAVVDENTVFQAASFSKTLTAYAAMILVERGKLALDEPLNRYLQRKYLPSQQAADQITLRMVLNHTSGLSNDSDGKDRRIYFTPGACFSYSGGGFRYLQQVIEAVTALPFAEFIDQEIIKPLGMKSSSFVLKEELFPLMAKGYKWGVPLPIAKREANAAYSLLTTPTDMAAFNMEICRPVLLKPETVAQMLRPAVKWQKNIYWGLGIGLLKSSTEDFFWHWGNNNYFYNMMITGKDSKTGVIIMTNSNTGMRPAERLAVQIINQYLNLQNDGLSLKTFDFIS
jgi:CubicO group peptidase (beta-lactamase class C family)